MQRFFLSKSSQEKTRVIMIQQCLCTAAECAEPPRARSSPRRLWLQSFCSVTAGLFPPKRGAQRVQRRLTAKNGVPFDVGSTGFW